MKQAFQILFHRNTILIASIVFGLLLGDYAHYLKPYTFYLLAIVLSFSTTGIVFSELKSKKEILHFMGTGILLNYFLFGAVLLSLAYWLSPSKEIFYGFVVIAATPPGVAIIPFSFILNGNIKLSIIGTLGAFLASIILAPLIIKLFSGNENLKVLPLFYSMIGLIIIPMLISRLLLLKPFYNFTVAVRGKVVNWGFALIIFTAVGINRHVFLSNFDILWIVALILFLSMFVLGQLYDFIGKKMRLPSDIRMSQNLLLTLKSTGFSVVIALELFNEKVVVPSAVMSTFVLGYFLFLSFKESWTKR